jgi:hypothetical protein
MSHSLEAIRKVAAEVEQNWLPKEIPDALRSACKCAPIDPNWPIQGPLEALKLMRIWDILEGLPLPDLAEYILRITHSHAAEMVDVNKLGYDRVYRESLTTKYVSIAWHLAGRYEYDTGLIARLESLGWLRRRGVPRKMLDFGAAPWIQTCYYASRGLAVTAVNQNVDGDCNRFGEFLATYTGRRDQMRINTFGSDSSEWSAPGYYDLIYCVDVLEHIPPEADGTPGWIKVAEQLLASLKPGGLWFVNAPLDIDLTPVHPVPYHPVHFTSPISVNDWAEAHGLIYDGLLWKKANK